MADLLSSIFPETFNFAQDFLLLGLVVLPIIWFLFALFYRSQGAFAQSLKDFADPHLIPHLLESDDSSNKKTIRPWKPLAFWSLLWILGILALAGPRWDFTTVKAFAPASHLVIALDMSRSMDAADIKPSRRVRARQEIEDLLNANAGINYALIAFDAAPHMITPLSDDTSSIKRLLPSLTSDIVYTQGASLAATLDMAADMLENASGSNKHVLVLSDGEFESSDADIYKATKRLNKVGAKLHGFGFGTAQGGPIPDDKGGLIKDRNGQAVITRLDENFFKRIVQDGGGLYKRASYLSNDTNAILSQIKTLGAAQEKAQKTTLFWEERFYFFLLPALLVFLPWLRRGAAFPVLFAVVMMGTASPAQAFEWKNLFLNKQQQAAHAVEQQQYDQAIENFDDPYQKGVAQYRAGDYHGAAQSFAQNNEPNAQEKARYNLGNAQLKGGQIEEAIKTYEDLLKDKPEHEDAKHNQEIAKKLLEQQQQDNQQNQKQDKQNQSGSSGDDKKNQDQQHNGDQKKEGETGQNKDQNDNKHDGENDSADDQKGQDHTEGEKSDEQGQEEQSGAKGDEDKHNQEQKNESGQRKNQSPERKENGEKQNLEEQKNQPSDKSSDGENPQQPNAQEHGLQTKPRTQTDINADQWLERMKSDPKQFLKNKFYIESQRAGAQKGDNKW